MRCASGEIGWNMPSLWHVMSVHILFIAVFLSMQRRCREALALSSLPSSAIESTFFHHHGKMCIDKWTDCHQGTHNNLIQIVSDAGYFTGQNCIRNSPVISRVQLHHLDAALLKTTGFTSVQGSSKYPLPQLAGKIIVGAVGYCWLRKNRNCAHLTQWVSWLISQAWFPQFESQHSIHCTILLIVPYSLP